MANSSILYDVDDKVGIITLNRPDKLNAISHELQHALTDAFARADADPATSVVLLRAEGRSFCAGYDIGAKGPGADDWRSDPTKAHAHLQPQLEFEMAPWLMKKPVIAAVQGHVLGGGCELVMLCDLTIAADNAIFGEPEVRFSAVGPAIVMPMIIGYKKARELLYFGDQIDAATALDTRHDQPHRAARRLARGEPRLRQAAVADLARGALCRPSARSTASLTRPGSAPRCMPGSMSSARFTRLRPSLGAVPRHRADRGGAGRGPVALRTVQAHSGGLAIGPHRNEGDVTLGGRQPLWMKRDG